MQKAPVIWTNVLVFSSTLLAALLLVPWYQASYGFDLFEICAAIFCLMYCGLSITAGYHRLWSHKTYQAHWSVRLLFALGGAFALQNSILHWSSDHRVHHKHVDDNDRDPYSAKRGFWFSHIGWMLRDYQGERYGDYSNVRDLQKDPIVMWQHRHYLLLALLTNVGIPLLLGWWHGDIIASLLLAGVLRLVISHHSTFFINSWAHMWGSQPYTDKNTAKDNPLLALFTHGEGYHNFHHLFESDYRNGIRWWHYDPTKWLIKLFSWVGLASQLRKTPQLKIDQAQLRMTLQRSSRRFAGRPDAEELIARLHQEYDKLLQQLTAFYQARKALLEAKRSKMLEDYTQLDLKRQLEELSIALAQQRQVWLQLTRA